MRFAFLLMIAMAGCGEHKEPATPAAKPRLPDLPVVAPKPTPPSTAAPIGWWRSDLLCLELHENGDFELAITPPSTPKIMIVGTARTTADGEQWKVELTPTKIWQARFIGNCRKVVMNAKQIEEQRVLGATLKPNQPTTLTLRIGPDATNVCIEAECATLRPETPTLRGQFDRPRTAESGTQQTWPKGEFVRLEIAGPSYTWGLSVGNGGTGLDTMSGDESSTITLVSPDHYELQLGKQRYTATRLAGHRLELCDASNKCGTLERGFDSDRTDVPCMDQ